MKQCPQCRKTYDDAAILCQYDGSPLLAAINKADPQAETLINREIVSSSFSFERLEITSGLHRYALVFTLRLNTPPAKDGFSLRLGWPKLMRISRREGLRETGQYTQGQLEYAEFTFDTKETLWPGQTIEIIGSKGKIQLEYEFDSSIWHMVDGKNVTLNWAVYFLDSMPVEGKVDWDDLNIY